MSLETKTVELKSVGLVLVLSQSNWLISRKKEKLEAGAREKYIKLREEEREFNEDVELMEILFYPALAACVVSDNCPTPEQCAIDVSEEDINDWYETARELNPPWFTGFDAIAEEQRRREQEAASLAIKKAQRKSETTSGEKMLAES